MSKRVTIGVTVVLLLLLLAKLPVNSQYKLTDWSYAERLFTTGIHGNRMVAAQDIYGLSVVSLDGSHGRELNVVHRLITDEGIADELVITEGTRANFPTMVIDQLGRRHIAWQEQLAGQEMLKYAVVTPQGKLESLSVLKKGAYAIQEPTLAISRDSVLISWVDNSSKNYDIKFGEITGTKLRFEETVEETAGTSLRPAMTTDVHNQVHVAWMESDTRGVQIRFATRSPLGWKKSIKLGEGSIQDIQQRGHLAIAYHSGHTYVVWSASKRNGVSNELFLHAASLNDAGSIVEGPHVLVRGTRPTFVEHENLSIVWQAPHGNSTQAFIGSFSDGIISNTLMLNDRTKSAMRPEASVDRDGKITVLWVQATESRGYDVYRISNRIPRKVTWWDKLAIDRDAPWQHLAFLFSGTIMLAFVYVGASFAVIVAALIFLTLLSRRGYFTRMSLGYRVVLTACTLLVLLDTPLAFVRATFFGPAVFLLTVILATAYTWLLLKKARVNGEFLQVSIVVLWMFWFWFFSLIPKNMLAI